MVFDILIKPLKYLDPGTGSFLIQMLLAGIMGGSVLVGIYWKKIKALFNRKIKNEVDPTSLPEDEEIK
jgi:hypothetical protein